MASPNKPRTDRLDCERMFVAVLDTGSFAAAARRLGTSPGQASKLVSRLEGELGVQLIKRTTRALAATDAGQAYHDRMKGLIDEFDALDLSVRSTTGRPTGRLRITAPVSFGKASLAPALLAFAAAYPEIQLDVSFSDRVVSLVDEGFDVAIRIGRLGDSSLVARKLCDARIVVVAAPDYVGRHGTPQSPDALAAHECIIDTNFRDPDRWRFATSTGEEDVPIHGRLRFSNGETCLAAAEAGLGIASVPSFIAGPSLRDGRVKQVLADASGQPLPIHALYPSGRHLALKVRALVDFLVGHYRGEPEWDRGW